MQAKFRCGERPCSSSGVPISNGYITWVNHGQKAWTVRAAGEPVGQRLEQPSNLQPSTAMRPNAETQIGQRHVSDEPMYLIINLGFSEGFSRIE
jgi:hypothetical protein